MMTNNTPAVELRKGTRYLFRSLHDVWRTGPRAKKQHSVFGKNAELLIGKHRLIQKVFCQTGVPIYLLEPALVVPLIPLIHRMPGTKIEPGAHIVGRN